MHSMHGSEPNDALDTWPRQAHVAIIRRPRMPDPTKLRTANDVRATTPIRHGAYLCLTAAHRERRIAAEVRALAARLALRNELEPGADHPTDAIAFLRRVDASPPPRATDIAD